MKKTDWKRHLKANVSYPKEETCSNFRVKHIQWVSTPGKKKKKSLTLYSLKLFSELKENGFNKAY